ncbi:MAG: InlB B-repeat-containing protein [Treponema sp.]|nr:InlB B-repeat-containing protein [Treponema sp.]
MKKIILKLASAALVVLLLSCGNELHESSEMSSDGKAYLVIGSADVARTIMPSEDDVKAENLTNLVLKGTPSGGTETELATAETYDALTELQIELLPGTWSFTLTAKLNGIDFCSTVEKEIQMGAVNSISFSMKAAEDFAGFGGIDITLSFKDSKKNVSQVKATLSQLDGTEVETKEISEDDFSAVLPEGADPADPDTTTDTYTVSYSRSASDKEKRLSSGTYRIVFDFYTDGITEPINSLPYYVRIDSGFTSKLLEAEPVSLNDVYTIEYNKDGGSLADANAKEVTKYFRKSETITLPELVKDKCSFAGWYTDEAFTKKITEIPTGSTGNFTLFAKWQAILLPFSVTIESLDNSAVDFTFDEENLKYTAENKYAYYTWIVDGETVLSGEDETVYAVDAKTLSGGQHNMTLTVKTTAGEFLSATSVFTITSRATGITVTLGTIESDDGKISIVEKDNTLSASIKDPSITALTYAWQIGAEEPIEGESIKIPASLEAGIYDVTLVVTTADDVFTAKTTVTITENE